MGYYKPREFFPGEYYHIYNRGNAKQNIFLHEEDYIYYLQRLRKAKDKQKVSLICYCLMPNHLHLLLRQDSEMPISKFISILHIGYSMYFNEKYTRVGHLFQSRFQDKHIDKDEYLLYLASYIHLNPVVDGLVKKPEDYQWSSYQDYIGLREGTLCDKEPVFLGKSPDWYKKITEEDVKEQLIKKEFQDKLNIRDMP
ncbi:MAG: hypothetical protein A3I88_02975 [Candidatus Portnoybacteria bacterium RIFCSPLOWO2_12_FULL_39_9]|nr:MAG: hypothetical protein A3H00_02885 [Candidatus Portnoybacteria bacterium RBG_13_40_8]OGZ35235.1 MAG: hypothetical protein A2646_02555 [Candidatus Portnoybacteria bacterium RIFCSPHIGHO2_02_FULL_39_12]OGZ38381.1 MAG: hypothetical protein A3F21_01955 [Candidatus Portnoybacteria bacterium RIFCSPLOWO2_01_FULL_38_39]OGZ40455.1 MAG: hypothetical protein A3I88_02975 [Candidatus Portnoybacteria bacterium RIFCSPLOWO2_12_FULL_39_9]